jgi:hypothetical protein
MVMRSIGAFPHYEKRKIRLTDMMNVIFDFMLFPDLANFSLPGQGNFAMNRLGAGVRGIGAAHISSAGFSGIQTGSKYTSDI